MRFLRALPSMIGLIIMLVGIPVVLAWWAGWPLPRGVPDTQTWHSWVHQPLTPTSLRDAVACVIWVLWAGLLLAVIFATARALGRARTARIHLPAPLHAVAASLIGSTVVAFAPHNPITTTVAAPLPMAATLTVDRPANSVEMPRTAPPLPDGVGVVIVDDCGYQYTVHHGDSLSTIAGHCLGSANRWPEIWHLNHGRFWPAVSGYRRLDNPDLILPHWTLRLPDQAKPPAGAPPLREQPQPGSSTGPAPTKPVPQPRSSVSGSASHHAPTTSTDARPGVDLPGGWIDLGLATAIAAAGTLVWKQRRRRYLPRTPTARLRLDDPALTPLPAVVARTRRVLQPATLDEDQDPPPIDEEAPVGNEPTAPPVATEHSQPVPGTSAPEGTTWAPAGLGLTGDGALAAARGLLIDAITGKTVPDPADRTQVVITAAALTTVLPGEVPSMTRLRITDSLGAALDILETAIIARSRLIYDAEATDIATLRDLGTVTDAVPPMVLICEATAVHQRARIAAILTQGARSDIRGILLGPWPTGTTVTIADNGVTSTDDQPGDADEAFVPARMTVLDPATALDILTAVADTVPRASVDGVPTTTPANSTPPKSPPRPHASHRDQAAAAAPELAGHTPGNAAEHRDPNGLTTNTAANEAHNGDAVADTSTAPDHDSPRRMAHIRVLGGAQISNLPSDGRGRPPLRTKARELLAYLAVHPHGVSEETMCDDILADVPISQVKTRLNTYVYNLRINLKAVAGPGEHLHRDNDQRHVGLDPTLIDCDLWRMHRHLAAAENATTPQQRSAALNAAIAEYHGPFADRADYDWAEPYREAIRQQIIDACASRAELLTPTDPAGALTVIHQAIGHDRYNEALYQQGIRLAADLGETKTTRTLIAALNAAMTDIGSNPSADTIALINEVTKPTKPPGL
jgi:Bacterial transcriptional activator domain/LysM domain